MSGDKTYNAAITALNTLQSNFAVLDSIRKSGRALNENAMPEMREWLHRIGYKPSDLNQINPIHIAGTKGKGSTSAFISSILCQYISKNEDFGSPYPRKIGLYTSPHLRSVRERIQINNEPISEQLFAKYFFEVWDRLEDSTAKLGPPSFLPKDASIAPEAMKPVYFRYLTLMAFHAYISEGVDTAVIECGIGGEYDSTNLLERPLTCGVTSLGIDHTAVLGGTIEDIAWHKAGVFKSASPSKDVYTVASQPNEAMAVLRARAEEKGLVLQPISRHKDIEAGTTKLGLAADFQKTNASLAVAIASAQLQALGVPADTLPNPLDPAASLPDEFNTGLQQVQWGGRCEIKRQGNVIWHLDGGHTIESIKLAVEWFVGCTLPSAASPSSTMAATPKNQTRMLLFNQQTRDANQLAKTLHAALREALPPTTTDGKTAPLFDKALFSTNITFSSSPAPSTSSSSAVADSDPSKPKGYYKPDLISMNTSAQDIEKLTVQNALAATWSSIDDGCAVEVCTSIEEAVRIVRRVASSDSLQHSVQVNGDTAPNEVVVLVIGSLHLVGGVLEVLESV